MVKIDIIIATKDRPEFLRILLASLVKSKQFIERIIIVAAGASVHHITNDFKENLNIIYITSVLSNQSFQKRTALDALPVDSKWVLFLDDDIIVPENTLRSLIYDYLNKPEFNEFGGFGLSNKIDYKDPKSRIMKVIGSIVGLYSSDCGTILKSGHAQSYLHCKRNTRTQWLNGLSAWRSDLSRMYEPLDINEKYSAYEDVNFSYSVSKAHKLLFVKDLMVHDQINSITNTLSSQQFAAGYRMRLKFVRKNNELSIVRFYIAQFFRILIFLIQHNGESQNVRLRTVIHPFKQ